MNSESTGVMLKITSPISRRDADINRRRRMDRWAQLGVAFGVAIRLLLGSTVFHL